MKTKIFIVIGICISISLSILVLIKLDKSINDLSNKYLESQSENYFLAEKLIELFNDVDSLERSLLIIQTEFNQFKYKSVIKTKHSVDTTRRAPRASRLNQYRSKSLPSEFREDENGWIEYCGTKYNPVPGQCLGDCSKTATGASTAKLIANPDYWGVAVTKKSLENGFKMHDTIEIQYMTIDGQWKYVLNKDGVAMRGLIEDRMNPRFNRFCCIDILTSVNEMKDIPFTGLAKVRIRKYNN